VRHALEEENKTLFGFVYILHPAGEIKAVEKDSYKVIPLEEVVEFCLAHEPIYQPALEYLDEHYSISYKERISLQT
jgi:hypothetical protein